MDKKKKCPETVENAESLSLSLSLSGFIGGSQPTCSGVYRHLLYRDVQLQGDMYFAVLIVKKKT